MMMCPNCGCRLELVGLKEAAAILGWDPRRVATYRSRGSFPAPVAELAMGPVWLRRQIEEYKREKQKGKSSRVTGQSPIMHKPGHKPGQKGGKNDE